ncbi:complement component C1q receptor [Gastrophryne carolinensis]
MSGERRFVFTLILGLLFLATCLPLSHGVPGEEQGAAFCLDNACYTVHLEKIKFAAANKSCIDKGGDLVSIRSEEEAAPVHNLLFKLNNSTQLNYPLNLWIGLYLKKNTCVTKGPLLKGFSWTTGSAGTSTSKFSNWVREPKSTCTREVCVSMILEMNSPNNFKWSDSSCSTEMSGYICKFDFKGMCQPLALAGPGFVEYETPFSFKSSSLTLLPFGTSAFVSCGHQGKGQAHMLLCKNVKDISSNMYQWGDARPDRALGPLCVSQELGCKYNNGGCEQECSEGQSKGSIQCQCKDGYVLAPDLVSCVLTDHCEPNPCDHNCTNHQHGYECTCSAGFVLAENKVNCLDVDECLEIHCSKTCRNTVGSYQCLCDKGFIQHGTECIDIDECNNSICSQDCLNIPGSYLCSCHKGYSLGSDKMSCLDIDECLNNPCAHSCHNTPGSYVCSCPRGFSLSSDRISCVPEQQDPNVIPYSHKEDDSLWNDMEATSISPRNMTKKPTPSSPPLDPMLENKTREAMSTLRSNEEAYSPSNSPVDQIVGEPGQRYSIVLLIAILGACAVVLVLLIVAGGILCYRRRNTKKKEAEKQATTTDNYLWVAESENKAENNEYR